MLKDRKPILLNRTGLCMQLTASEWYIGRNPKLIVIALKLNACFLSLWEEVDVCCVNTCVCVYVCVTCLACTMHAGSWERSSCLARHPQTTGEPVRQPYTCRPTRIGSGESDVNPTFNFKRRKWQASDFDLGWHRVVLWWTWTFQRNVLPLLAKVVMQWVV